MSPGTHFLISWTCANAVELPRRDRALVTVSGLAPDIDGLGYLVDLFNPSADLYGRFHHVLGHNLGACLLAVAVAFALARRRLLTAALVAATFHLHLVCDVISGRGPDNYQWPISYLAPFSDAWVWVWEGQWYLHGPQNIAVSAAFIATTVLIALKRGRTPVDLVSTPGDRRVREAFSNVFGKGPGETAE